jgi:hypothetical protein
MVTISHLVMVQLHGVWGIMIIHVFIRKNAEMEGRCACLQTMMETVDVFLSQLGIYGIAGHTVRFTLKIKNINF